MGLDEFATIWRVMNATGSAVAIPALLALIKRNRGYISRRSMSLMQALLFAHVMMLVASVESVARHEPLAARTALISVVVGWTLLALYFPKVILRSEDHRRPRK